MYPLPVSVGPCGGPDVRHMFTYSSTEDALGCHLISVRIKPALVPLTGSASTEVTANHTPLFGSIRVLIGRWSADCCPAPCSRRLRRVWRRRLTMWRSSPPAPPPAYSPALAGSASSSGSEPLSAAGSRWSLNRKWHHSLHQCGHLYQHSQAFVNKSSARL